MPHSRKAGLAGATAVLGAVAALAAPARADLLYDGSLNTKPGAQGWTFAGTGGVETAPMGGGATTLDTTLNDAFQAGYGRTSPLALDRLAGYTIRFDVQVLSENHGSPDADKNGDGLADRAGFSVIVLGSDKKGVELGFWGNEIWPQSDSPLFLHAPAAERAFFDTTGAGTGAAGLIRYDLTVLRDGYSLFADGAATPLLSGSLRDYTAFVGFPDPYETPNFLFFGDNTTSARASFKIARVEANAAPIPEPGSLALLLGGVGIGGARYLRRRVRRS